LVIKSGEVEGYLRTILNEVALRIAGEIVLSKNVGKTMKMWRKRFKISQAELALHMGISPSLISDYESGRRRSPGSTVIKRFVNALLEIDRLRGLPTVSRIVKLSQNYVDYYEPLIELKEFPEPLDIEEFCKRVGAKILAIEGGLNRPIYGYTVVDALKLLLAASPHAYFKLYGFTNQRAMVFTNVDESAPLLAIIRMMSVAMSSLRPSIVVLHGVKEVDELSVLMAKRDYLPLAVIQNLGLDELLGRLRSAWEEEVGIEESSGLMAQEPMG